MKKRKIDREKLFLEIAQKFMPDLETLEARNSDSLDFHDTAIWNIHDMIEEAYNRGLADGKKK